MDFKVIIDPGHGGGDPGAVYNGRQEKDDNLNLALAVGEILEQNGVDVVYTRTNDVYQTPFEKAKVGNENEGNLFVSFHRNSGPNPNQYNGVEVLVYDKSGLKNTLAENIATALEGVGFKNLGVKERPGLVVLRRTQMPAVLIETGFINNDEDNKIYDEKNTEIAKVIAAAILDSIDKQLDAAEDTGKDNQSESIPEQEYQNYRKSDKYKNVYNEARNACIDNIESDKKDGYQYTSSNMIEQEDKDDHDNNYEECDHDDYEHHHQKPYPEKKYYRVQVGAFKQRTNADNLLYELEEKGYPAFIIADEDGLFKVQVGAFEILMNAIKMEAKLRRAGYSTYITT